MKTTARNCPRDLGEKFTNTLAAPAFDIPHTTGGLFAQSSWLFGATYVHNLAINFLVLSLSMAALFIAPRVALAAMYHIITSSQEQIPQAAGIIAAALVFGNVELTIIWLVRHRLRTIKAERRPALPILSLVASLVVLWFFYQDMATTPLVPNTLLAIGLSLGYVAVVRTIWALTKTSGRAKNRFLASSSLCGGFLAVAWFFVSARTYNFIAPQDPWARSKGAWEGAVQIASRLFGIMGVAQNSQLLGQVAAAVALLSILAIFCLLLSTRHVSSLWWLEILCFSTSLSSRWQPYASFSLIVLASWCFALSLPFFIPRGLPRPSSSWQPLSS